MRGNSTDFLHSTSQTVKNCQKSPWIVYIVDIYHATPITQPTDTQQSQFKWYNTECGSKGTQTEPYAHKRRGLHENSVIVYIPKQVSSAT